MKRNITLAAGSLLAALLLNANLGHPAAAQEQAARPKTLSESYRDAPEFQKIAPFKVFDNLYHVGLGFVPRNRAAAHGVKSWRGRASSRPWRGVAALP
jgi:hypothetical protein